MKAGVAPTQVVGLDLLRLAAALMVTVYHLTYLEWADPHARGSAAAAPFLAYASWTPFVDTGWVGVQIFFVISGFVIAYTASGRSPSSFLRGRVLRLVPGIWVCATMSVAALLVAGTPFGETLRLYLLSLTLFPTGPWVASSYWTLSLEIVFYGIVFLILCRGRFERIEAVVVMLGGISCVAWLATVLAVFEPSAAGHAVTAAVMHRLAKLLLVQHGCFFALGAMIWIIRQWGATIVRLVVATAFAMCGLVQIEMEVASASTWANLPMNPVPPMVALLAALGFIVASLRWNAAVHRLLGRHAAAVRTMGLMTYPLYLLHQPFGIPLSGWQLRAGVPPAVALIVSTTLVMLLAWLVAVRLEPPLRGWMRPKLELIDRAWGRYWSGPPAAGRPASGRWRRRPALRARGR